MKFAKLNNGALWQIGPSHELWPDDGFPPTGPSDEFLAAHNAVRVQSVREYDAATQKLIPVEPYPEAGAVYDVQVVPLAAEEIEEKVNARRATMRADALQIRRAMRQLGIKASFQAWLATQSEDVQEDFEYMLDVPRLYPTVETARVALGWTPEQMDDFFALAQSL